MEQQELIIGIATAFGAFNALFLGIAALLTRKGYIEINRLLALLWIAISFTIAKVTLFSLFGQNAGQMYYPIYMASLACLMPLTYLYYLQANHNLRIGWRNKILHFLPALFYLVFSRILYQIIPYPQNKGIYIVLLLQQISYLYILWAKVIQQPNKQSHNIALHILSGATVIHIALVIHFFVGFPMYILTGITYTFVLYMMSYKGLGQLLQSLQHKKYKTSSLDDTTIALSIEKLEQVMHAQKLYLNPDLTLPFMANSLGIPLHQLSQILNDKLQLSFPDFINSYRINEAKKLLHQPGDKMKIAVIAMECGFNSISAFNAAFKKFTGYSPSQYRNAVQDYK
jgi:AraC-like DNA-binding protein